MYQLDLKTILRIAFILSVLFNNSLMAADLNSGKQIVMNGNQRGATACQSCHGIDGAGNAAANFPRLAGLDAGYLAKQLHDYAKGIRSNPIMKPIATALNTKEIEDVTAYYSGQQAPHSPTNIDQTVLDEGKALVERGDWDKTLPACIQCHGPGARGAGKNFPGLAGQHAGYLEAQLNAWKQGIRKNDPNELMKGIAERLSDSQIKAAAAYLSSMKPAEK